MSWANDGWEHVRRVFRLPPTRRRIRDELDDELRFHLEGRIEDLMEREGLSRADAEREARRRFGDYQAYRQEARSIDETMFDRRNRMELFDTLGRETRHALRSLLRAPSFSLIVLVTLALGLGAATDDLHAARSRRAATAAVSERGSDDPHRHAVAEGQGRRRVRDLARAVLLLQEEQRRAGESRAVRHRHAAHAGRRRSPAGARPARRGRARACSTFWAFVPRKGRLFTREEGIATTSRPSR